MSLVKRLSRRERKEAYRTWLDHIETKNYEPADGEVIYTDFKFIAKSGRTISITVIHTDTVRTEQLSYKVYRQVYRALRDSTDESAFAYFLYITKRASRIYLT